MIRSPKNEARIPGMMNCTPSHGLLPFLKGLKKTKIEKESFLKTGNLYEA